MALIRVNTDLKQLLLPHLNGVAAIDPEEQRVGAKVEVGVVSA